MNNSSKTCGYRKCLAAIFFIGFVVRLPTIITGYHASNDMFAFIDWGRVANENGIAAIYSSPTINYPPLLLYYFDAAVALQESFDSREGVPGAPGSDGLAVRLIQALEMVADLAIAGLLAFIFWPRSRRIAALVSAMWLFNPVVLYVSAVWGQTDSVFTFFLLASVVFLSRRAWLPAWVLYALALATKLQSIALLPLLVSWSLAKHGWRGLLGGTVAATSTWVILFAPWLLSGRLPDLMRVFTTPTEKYVVISAYNVWYLLLGGNLKVLSAGQPTALPLSYQVIGYILFAALALAIVWLATSRRSSLALSAASLCLAMFLVLTPMHERHAFAAIAFLVLALGEQSLPRSGALKWIYLLLTLSILYNLVTIAPPAIATSISVTLAPVNSALGSALLAGSYLSTLVSIAGFAWMVILIRPGGEAKEAAQKQGGLPQSEV